MEEFLEKIEIMQPMYREKENKLDALFLAAAIGKKGEGQCENQSRKPHEEML